MKRYIRCNDSDSYVWTAKYVDVAGKVHKVAANLPTRDYEAAEEMFDEIIPEPYTSLNVLGKVLNLNMAIAAEFEILAY